MSNYYLNTVWDFSEAKGTPLLVLIALADYSNEEGISWPSLNALSKRCRIDRSNVSRSISTLVSMGEIERAGYGDGRYGSTRYRIKIVRRRTTSEKQGSAEAQPSVGAEVHTSRCGDAPLTIIEPPSLEPSIYFDSLVGAEAHYLNEKNDALQEEELFDLKQEVFDDFGKFWKLYPVKKKKGLARKAFKKASGKVHVSVLLEGVVLLNANLPEDGRFVPHASTWLTQERWTDEYVGNTRGRGFSGNGKGSPDSYADTYQRAMARRRG